MICLKCNHCRDIDLCRDPCSNLDENEKSKPYASIVKVANKLQNIYVFFSK